VDRVLLQAATEANDSFRVKDALSLIWSVLPEKPIDNAVKGYRKRLPIHVSQPMMEILNIPV